MRLLLLLFLFNVLLSCSGQPDRNVLHLQGATMGTSWNVTIVDVVDAKKKQQLDKDIKQALVNINQQFSTYIPSSEISQFNATNKTQPFKVSKPVVQVIKAAQTISEATQGAFDISVAPLIDLWGFGSEVILFQPAAASIQQARANIGYQHLEASDNPPQLIKAIPQLQIDLSAIAKGYAVDSVAALMDKQGILNYLVEIGGEIKVKGVNPTGEKWQIAVEKPIINASANKKQIAHQIISLENIAVATSGDYHNYFEEKGIRYSHTLDPTTGKPVTHQLASVTVLHESAMMADGYATAIMVLGDKKGLAFAKKEGLQVLMLVRDKDRFTTLSTLNVSEPLLK